MNGKEYGYIAFLLLCEFVLVAITVSAIQLAYFFHKLDGGYMLAEWIVVAVGLVIAEQIPRVGKHILRVLRGDSDGWEGF